MSTPSIFIDDGYTMTDKIPPAGQLPALAYTYRPAEHRTILHFLNAAGNPDEAVKRGTQVLLDHVHNTDAKDGDGNPVPLTESFFTRLRPRYRSRMLDCVLGYDVPSRETDAKN